MIAKKNVRRPASNIQHPMDEMRAPLRFFIGRWMLDVGRRTFLPLAIGAILVLISTAAVGAPSPFPEPSSANSLFKNRTFGPIPPPTPTPSPRRIVVEEKEPIPKGWWIGGIAAVVLALAALLYGTARASRSSNLFGRQYRFPEGGDAALRLGAMRSGGHMATIRFGDGPPLSKTKNG